MLKSFSTRSQGADLVEAGVRYRTWAPGKEEVEVVIYDANQGTARTIPLHPEGAGYFSGIDGRGAAGDLYKYRFGGQEWPDPASRFNPSGVHGPSQVIDPRDYEWRDESWSPPSVADLVIYELHIGTFTPEGTFRGAIGKLDHLVRLGINAIEIMPVADFPGERNWGYDGVLLYAPARVYGTPNDLRALVAAAHAHGLAVILDVVYNHLGPDGNYLGTYSGDYFNPEHKTPWGDAFNFELGPVRNFFAENPGYWLREFHIDGFRLDATHAILDTSEPHFLAEVAERVHSLGGFITVEDERNEPRLILPPERGGFDLDAAWADDFHHVVRVMLTGARESYYRAYRGTVDELVTTLRDGWLLREEVSKRPDDGAPNECAELPPERFIFCVTNHDQIGNQAFGRRLSQKVSPAAFRAASALLCLVPYTPLIFMGQEWATTSPFQFFTDHETELGHKVTAGRRAEFNGFEAFRDPAMRAQIPDPQAAETFLRSKLRWDELEAAAHAGVFRLYSELLRLRRELPALRDRRRENWDVSKLRGGIVQMNFGGEILILIDLLGGHENSHEDVREWEPILSSNEPRFGGAEPAALAQPEVRLLRKRAQD
ncbi:MAG: malto-oligosyltrehalose trehalohydrolase [Chthoniobacterales bacterium]